MLEGHKLYDLVEKTYPEYDGYAFDHMLIDRKEDPNKVLDLMDLRPGDAVGDIGCGSGFYTLLFAEKVGPTGQAWAIDGPTSARERLLERLKEPALLKFTNIRVFRTPVNETFIPPATLDAALLSHADFYAFTEQLEENRQMLGALYRSLKATGRMAVVQNMKIVPDSTNEIILQNFKDARFQVDRVYTDPDSAVSYFLFQKPLNGPPAPPPVAPRWIEESSSPPIPPPRSVSAEPQ